MAISQQSMRVTFMQPLGGIKKADAEQDVIHLNQSRVVWVGCLDSIIMLLQSARTVFHCLCRIFLVFLQRKEYYISTVNNLNNSN